VDLLLLCGVPVLVAAKALLGVSFVIGVAIIVLGAVYHSMMTIFTTLVPPTCCGTAGHWPVCKHCANVFEVPACIAMDVLPVASLPVYACLTKMCLTKCGLPRLTCGRETALHPVAPVTTTSRLLLRYLTFKHRASVSGPPSGAQVGVGVLGLTAVLFVYIRLDRIEQHAIFCFEPAAAPLDPHSTLPANPPQSTGV